LGIKKKQIALMFLMQLEATLDLILKEIKY